MRTRLLTVTRSRARGDAGLTLVELLVAMGIFAVVLTVAITGFVQLARSTTLVSARATALQGLTAAADRVLYDAMLGRQFGIASDTEVQVDVVRISGQCRRVRYLVQPDPVHPGKLRVVTYRTEVASGSSCGSGPGSPVTTGMQVVIDNLDSASFDYLDGSGALLGDTPTVSNTGSINYVRVALTAHVPGQGGKPVTLESGTEVRNQ